MSRTKTISRKPIITKVAGEIPKEEDVLIEIEPLKVKKPIEIDLPEEPAVIEEKLVEEDPLAAEETEEAAVEEITLDDDELNPFGDKWEQ